MAVAAPLTVTVADILLRAYRAVGIARRPLVGLGSSEQQEGVNELNGLLDSLKADRSFVYAISRTLVPINANQQAYTIGLDSSQGNPDWLIERPQTIERAGFIWTNTTPPIEDPFEIYSEQQWAALSPKGLTSTVPYVLYYQPFTPNGTVNLWPIPTSNWQAALYLWSILDQVGGADDVLEMPPAYQDLLVYSLAMRLSPLYPEHPLNPMVVQQAMQAQARIRSANYPALLMQTEAAARGTNYNVQGRYNPLTNRYR